MVNTRFSPARVAHLVAHLGSRHLPALAFGDPRQQAEIPDATAVHFGLAVLHGLAVAGAFGAAAIPSHGPADGFDGGLPATATAAAGGTAALFPGADFAGGGIFLLPHSRPTERGSRIPWFRAHIAVASDPGRLVAVHLVHSGLLAGWAAAMLLYEAVLTDASDPVFNPAWRQGSFVAPFPARLGCPPALLPAALLAHLCAAGLFLLAASWHWAFWDLDVFLARARVLALHFARIFGIHLALAGSACFLFGSYHLERVGVWTSDAFGGFGAARPLVASFSPAGAALLDYSAQVAHHLAAGVVLAAVGAWHSSSWPGVRLGAAIAAFSLEGLLASSICPFFFSGAAACGLMWYGSSLTPNDLYGPTRFSWDASFFEQEILFRAAAASWAALGESLLLADYVGVNPAKGGLFRAGPMIKGDGVVQAWAGHTLFSGAAGPLSVRRMPAFFETFPVLLVDARGVVRAAIPFRRAEARSSPALRLSFAGGIFAGSSARAAPLVKNFARKAQLGEVLCFGAAVLSPADGVLRSALRGWFTYAHAALVLLFWFGHLWHAGRAVLRDAWTGLAGVGSEYGLAEKIAS